MWVHLNQTWLKIFTGPKKFDVPSLSPHIIHIYEGYYMEKNENEVKEPNIVLSSAVFCTLSDLAP